MKYLTFSAAKEKDIKQDILHVFNDLQIWK